MMPVNKNSAYIILALLVISVGSFSYLLITGRARTNSLSENPEWIAPTQYDSDGAYLDRTAEPDSNSQKSFIVVQPSIVQKNQSPVGEKYNKQYPYAEAFPYQSPKLFVTYKNTPNTLYVRMKDDDTAFRALTELDEYLSSFEINTHTLQQIGVVFVFQKNEGNQEPLIQE